MATALEHITSALRLIGIVAEGELPSSETADDALVAFNQMLDSWSIASAHSFQLQEIPWGASVESKTVGPTGDFVGNAPISVKSSTYYMINGVQYPLYVVNEDEYRAWCSNPQEGTPEYIFTNDTSPNPTIYLYPTPSQAITLYLSSVIELTQISDLSDEIVVPSGYMRALRYNLALELSAEFGVEPSTVVVRIARGAKAAILNKNLVNSKSNRLHLPYPMGRAGANILNG